MIRTDWVDSCAPGLVSRQELSYTHSSFATNLSLPGYPPESSNPEEKALRQSSILRGTVTLLLAGAMTLAAATNAQASPAQSAAALAAATPDISLTNVKAHLQQFQTIATSNGGNRRSNTAGYTASVNYVFDRLVGGRVHRRQAELHLRLHVGAGPNVIADWPGGDANTVYMFGAHLDGVAAGPGINDNASGSSTLLEMALTLAATNPTMLNHVRFAFWTDEEQGLNGSEFYANSLPAAERTKIKGYFNFDMVGSTNGGYFINRITSSLGQALKAYYDTNFPGLAPEENVEGAGRSDDASFNAVGIQTCGVAAGASANKTSAQVSQVGRHRGRRLRPLLPRAPATRTRPTSTTRCSTGPATPPRTRCGRSRPAPRRPRSGPTPSRPRPAGPPTRPAPTPPPPARGSAATRRTPPPAAPSSSAPPSSGVNDLVTGRLAGIERGRLRHRRRRDQRPLTGGHPAGQRHAERCRCPGTWRTAPTRPAPTSSGVSIVHNGGTTTLFTQAGAAANRNGAWALGTWNISRLRRPVGAHPDRGRRRLRRQPGRGRRRRRQDHAAVVKP